ncbi:MAG: hypothetical protein U0800_22470 [Isosphaeraceae bacterium]
MPAPTAPEAADDIRRQMAQIRSQLHQDMTGVVESATSVADWRSYVRERPWLSLGLAFAAGYVVVPRRRHEPTTIVLPQSDAAVPVSVRAKPNRNSLLMTGLKASAGLLWPIALRAAQRYAQGWVEDFLANNMASPLLGQAYRGPSPGEPTAPPPSQPTPPPWADPRHRPGRSG